MLANRLVQKIMSAIPDVVMNGDPNQRYHGTHIDKHSYKARLWRSAVGVQTAFTTCPVFAGCLHISGGCHTT